MSLSLGPNTKVFLALEPVDMRKGLTGYPRRFSRCFASIPSRGALFLFRGRRGDRLKAIYWMGGGLCLYAKRLEKGRFVWPTTRDGSLRLSTANWRC